MRRSTTGICFAIPTLVLGLALSAGAQTRATVTVGLIDTLSTGSSQPGDSFTAVLATPLVVKDRIVAERGTHVTGQVVEVVSSGRLKRLALIRLHLKTVHAPSGRIPLETGDLTIKADSNSSRNLLIIGGAVGAGAAIGGAAGGAKGAAIGAAAGAGAGVAGTYLTRQRDIVLPPETTLTFHVNSVVISPRELARLQPVAHRQGDVGWITVRRRHEHDDEDEYEDEYEYEDEDEYEDEIEIELEHLIKIEIEIEDEEAKIKIRWPHRSERLILKGDDLEEIIEELSERTGFTVKFLRTKIKFKVDD